MINQSIICFRCLYLYWYTIIQIEAQILICIVGLSIWAICNISVWFTCWYINELLMNNWTVDSLELHLYNYILNCMYNPLWWSYYSFHLFVDYALIINRKHTSFRKKMGPKIGPMLLKTNILCAQPRNEQFCAKSHLYRSKNSYHGYYIRKVFKMKTRR